MLKTVRVMRLAACLAVTATVSAPQTVRAHQVEPMIYTLTPTGQAAARRLIVTNTDGTPLDLEIAAFLVTVDIDGKRTFTPADDAFLIYPPQATIQPGAAQSFQVRYIGDVNFDKGRIYVVKVTQLNVNYTSKDTGNGQTSRVGIIMNFNTTAVVQPPKFLPSVAVTQNLTPGPAGRPVATVSNTGNGVADLSALHWTITRSGKSEPLPSEAMKFGETSMLAPGSSRIVSVDPAIDASATLSLVADH